MRVRIREIEISYQKNAFYFSATAVNESQHLVYIEGNCTLIETEVKILKYNNQMIAVVIKLLT